ncbi:MarR family winged helix-turn-helix transcriptional regulator [Rhodovibrionaceae bacterium A322]
MTNDTLLPTEEQITAWARLVRTSQDLLGKVEKDLKAAGHPPLVWYDLLLELGREHHEDQGLRPYELQQEMLLSQYNLSRLIDRMDKAGLIRRLPCADDGRGFLVQITEQGKAAKQDIWPAYQQAIARHFAAKLSQQEAKDFARLLLKLR